MQPIARKLLVLSNAVSTAMAWISGLLFLLLALYMTADVTSRSLGGPFTGVADQFASFTLALGGTWALARALSDGSHVRIDLFLPLYGRRLRGLAYTWSMLMTVVFAAVLTQQAWILVGKSAARKALVPQSLVDLPLAVPQALSAVGYTMFTVQSAVMTIVALVLLFSDHGELVEEIEHPAPGEKA
ncbi:TRAP transporter small permease subunit [Salipiger thiooxidans]|uniref:TRAP transporter small permease n=1 Tax=Salipiger thiooxidans TaxID=282683 RepID=UPI001A9073AE|nr:TRAP transporter small permease subunit [Salipiger thiooxidans]MBN8189187.1 TRAP transporter small permease subunit [Salipiger thiooxidans]